jgi:molecular chaperone DnaJ
LFPGIRKFAEFQDERLLDIEGHKPSAKKGKGFFQDVVDNMRESVK